MSLTALTAVADDLRFAVIGDFGDAPRNAADQGMQQIADMIDSWNVDLIATVGDNNYDTGSASTIDANIGQFYHEYIGNYTGTYGAGSATNRFFPAIGNHDYNSTAGYTPYLNYFTLPSGPGNERYYDFVQGPVHFFMVNSDSHEPHGITSISTQAAWLQAGLAASTSQWNLVFMHHSPYASGNTADRHGSDPTVQWDYTYADAVITGHNHFYERLEVGALPYYVVGTSGHDLDPFTAAVAGSKVRNNGDYGAMLIDADENTLSLKYFNRSGQQIDSFNLGAPNQSFYTRTFEQGKNSYSGTVDTSFQQNSPNVDNGADTQLNVDSDDPSGTLRAVQTAVRFDDLFGPLPHQVPPSVQIVSATLELRTTNSGDGAQLHRMLLDWDESPASGGDNATWAAWGDGLDGDNGLAGIQIDDVEALSLMDLRVHTPESGRTIFDVTNSILAWQADPSSNHGWLFRNVGNDGWDFYSSEGLAPPILTINYVPEPSAGVLAVVGIALLSCATARRASLRSTLPTPRM